MFKENTSFYDISEKKSVFENIFCKLFDTTLILNCLMLQYITHAIIKFL